MIRLAICDDSTWYVKAFIGEHNHQLVESCGEKKHLSSHRHIDGHTIKLAVGSGLIGSSSAKPMPD
jgi:hypothetical protein